MSYLWIVLGTIFAGAVHDYLSGMLSIRHDGESLPESISYLKLRASWASVGLPFGSLYGDDRYA